MIFKRAENARAQPPMRGTDGIAHVRHRDRRRQHHPVITPLSWAVLFLRARRFSRIRRSKPNQFYRLSPPKSARASLSVPCWLRSLAAYRRKATCPGSLEIRQAFESTNPVMARPEFREPLSSSSLRTTQSDHLFIPHRVWNRDYGNLRDRRGCPASEGSAPSTSSAAMFSPARRMMFFRRSTKCSAPSEPAAYRSRRYGTSRRPGFFLAFSSLR